jgi:flagellar biosynthesis/type III secretory pathway M-ring protein FliF/YscJ
MPAIGEMNIAEDFGISEPMSANEMGDVSGSAPRSDMIGEAFDRALPMMMAGALTEEETQNLEQLDPVERLRLLIQEREEETVQILRNWMNEDDEAPQ